MFQEVPLASINGLLEVVLFSSVWPDELECVGLAFSLISVEEMVQGIGFFFLCHSVSYV